MQGRRRKEVLMARRPELFIRELSDEEAAHLLRLARRSKSPIKQHRAMLLFASYQGQGVPGIARLHRASATHVADLIHAFNERGFAALDPRKGGGRPRRIDEPQRAAIVKVALARPTDRGEPFTSWSLTKLRAHLVSRRIVATISPSQLRRILREHGIRFLHHKTWKTSPDPDFEAKKDRVLDLYTEPPEGSRVLCLDEFGPLNLQPHLGAGWYRSKHTARFRASYTRRAGVRHLLAAYDPATGRMYGHLRATKTWREVRELLRSLRTRFREHLIVVLDNFSPHHKRELRDWTTAHDIELVYLPTYASWLNLIECQFQALRRFTLTGTDYASHAEQGAAIHAYLRWHDRNARPAKPWRIKAEVHHSLPAVAA
jgi:transposase